MLTEPSDGTLWTALRELVAQADPVPAAVLQAARSSISWLDPDAALAELIVDSAAPADAAVPAGWAVPVGRGAVRGAGQPRLLTFAAEGMTIEVEADLAAAGSGTHLIGQIVPAQRVHVRLDHHDGTRDVQTDEFGRFMLHNVPRGRARFVCTPADPVGAARVHTAWVLL